MSSTLSLHWSAFYIASINSILSNLGLFHAYHFFSWCYRQQVVELDFLYPSEGIHRRWDNGYRITSMAATSDQAALILSVPKRKLGDETQETLRTSTFPSNHVKVVVMNLFDLMSTVACYIFYNFDVYNSRDKVNRIINYNISKWNVICHNWRIAPCLSNAFKISCTCRSKLTQIDMNPAKLNSTWLDMYFML